ncbi:MAG: dynamin family protein, partial [Ilumatobacteraceae bacterium]
LLSLELIHDGTVSTASQLATARIDRSGFNELRAALLSQFTDRRGVLKARSGLLAVDGAIRARPDLDTSALSDDIERITAGAHEISELRLLNTLRAGATDVKPADAADMERLLGTSGTGAADRLGLDSGAEQAAITAAAAEQLARWQRKAESPMSTPEVVDAARVVIRTCEGILTEASTGSSQ